MTDGNPQLVIRPACAADIETLAAYNRNLALETEGLNLDVRTVLQGVRAALADDRKARYFVACRGETVVGQLMHTWEWSDWRNGHIWWLQSVYVHPDHRRQGVMRRLIEHVLSLAEADPEVVGIRLYVENHNVAAQAVYQRLGLRNSGYLVMERIPPRPGL
jgi:ribosomal protein S18 acetylase RimI-like enzyme